MFDLPPVENLPNATRPSTFSDDMDAWILAQKQFSLDLKTVGSAIQLSTSSNTTGQSATIGAAGASTSFNLGAGAGFWTGMLVNKMMTSDGSKGMLLRILTYNPVDGSGTQKIVTPYGSGTASAWSISQAADPGNVGKQALWIPARAMIGRNTNGAVPGSFETTTNKVMLRTLDFDASTIEYAQFDLGTGNSWDGGTITAKFIWSHAATTTNFKISWGLQALALGDGENFDQAFGTAQYANDTGGTTDREYVSPETSAVTASNSPAAGKRLIIQLLRKADDATNDTLAIDGRLSGIILYISTKAGTDV